MTTEQIEFEVRRIIANDSECHGIVVRVTRKQTEHRLHLHFGDIMVDGFEPFGAYDLDTLRDRTLRPMIDLAKRETAFRKAHT